MIKGLNKSNSMIAADRQLLDDINYARQRAIADHTSVYMVFIPPNIITWTLPPSPALTKAMVNLYAGQYNTYALLSLRSVGEQPGRLTPRYLTPWKSLPAGVYIATNKLTAGSIPGLAPTFFNDLGPKNRRHNFLFPWPPISHPQRPAPMAWIIICLISGLIIWGRWSIVPTEWTISSSRNRTAVTTWHIPLARGSLFYQRNADGTYAQQPPDISELTPGGCLLHNLQHHQCRRRRRSPVPGQSEKLQPNLH